MKAAIQLSKAPTILRQLQRRGKWTGRPGGVTVRMWTRSNENGIRVCWQCFPRTSRSVAGSAASVTQAITQYNDTLTPPQAPIELGPAIAAPTFPKTFPAPLARQEWLPYKDAEL